MSSNRLQPLFLDASVLPDLPEGWIWRKFEDASNSIPVGRKYDGKSVVAGGMVPVVDQSASGIMGHHNDAPGVSASLMSPVFTFANHTCAMRWMTSPFSCIQNVFAFQGRDGVLTQYLYYASQGRVVLEEYKGHAPVFRSMYIPVPPLDVQRNIVALLASLDNRLSLLRETNSTLESIAQALFKSWFVDFDPVRARAECRTPEGMDEATAALFPDSFEETELGAVPRGWRICAVEEFAERVGMGPFGSNIKVETFVDTGIPVISGQHLKQLLVEDNTFNFITPDHAARLSKSCVHAGDVIFTHAGSIGQVSLLHKDAAFSSYVLSQRQFFLRCNAELVSPELATLFFKSPTGQHQLLANTSQVGVPSIARPVSYLRSIRMVVPPPALNQRFASIVGAINDRVMANRKQLSALSEIRDTLLPRLISGQLRLPEAQTAREGGLA